MRLPTAQEINPVPEDLDGQVAAQNFLGKTPEQITREFRDHGMSYQEDLMFMGVAAFCFYFPAAVDYVASPEAVGDSDVINSLCSVVEFRLIDDFDEIKGAFPAIVRFADHVLAHYDDFDLTPAIYGDLRPRFEAIRQKCVTAGNSPD